MKTIPLSAGRFALVDDCDVDLIIQFKWSFQVTGYAWRMSLGKAVYMHRFLLNAPEGLEVDHIDGNGLNNVRCNLRVCSHAQNLRNQKLRSTNKSGFRGVSFDKERGKWFACIKVNGRTIALGRYPTPEEAATARDLEAVKQWGEFASVS